MSQSAASNRSATQTVEDSRLEVGPENAPQPRSPASSRRTTKGLFKIVSFFLLVALLATGLNALINHGLRRTTVSKFGSLNRVVDGKVNADIVISGSSRALCHYDPRILEKATGLSAYNIGMNASQIDLESAILKTYLKHNAKPKLVIQNLDLFSFETTEKGSVYDPGYFLPYLKEKDIYNFLHNIDPNVWKWKYIPLYGYAVEDMRFTWVWGLLGCIGINGHEDYFQGYNPRYGRWTADFANFRSGITNGVSYRIESKGVTALEEIIRTCQSQNIQIILVYSPEYSEMQALESNRREIIERFKSLADRFQIPFWDYSESNISRQQELFNNSQHLNAEGAESFSVDLAKRLSESDVLGHARLPK